MDETLKNTATTAAREAQKDDREVPEGAVEIPVEIVDSGRDRDAQAACEAPAEPVELVDRVEDPELSVAELQAELAETRAALEATRADLDAIRTAFDEEHRKSQEEIRDIRMRSQAELENFKKRLGREHDEHLKYAAEKVMKDLVPSLDNLELAITYGSREEACKNMLQGIQMTQKLLLDAVARHGLVRVGEEGEAFDPARHEAMGCESRPELPADSVARVMQSGYTLEGRLLRPAKVMVNRP